MASSTADPPSAPRTFTDPTFTDPTFRTNNTQAAEAYQAGRPGYASTLIREVLTYHTSTGGGLNTVLDVGCGPGTATRSLSHAFTHAFGCDPGASMIATAASIPSTTLSGHPIAFAVGPAEELDRIAFPSSNQPLQPGCVSLITAAMAAHWFDLPSFYASALRLLAPGGTIALWTASSYYCDPHATPNAAKVQAILFDLERNILAPYELPGNRLSRDMYDNLPLPWTCEPPVPGFEEGAFVRREWNRDGRVEVGEKFLSIEEGRTLEQWAKGCDTASMVVRWREANREKVEKGEAEVEDCVEGTVRRLREAMGGKEWLQGGPSMVCLLIKKKA